MPNWQSAWVEVNGLRLHAILTGGGGPALVLAHGFSDDGLCWTPVARALAADYDVVMPDARGHGESEPPTQAFTPDDLADDLAGVINGLGLRRPIVLGHSMGAMTALLLAARHPALPRAIALEDPPPGWAPGAEPMFNPAWRAGARAWLEGLQRQSRAAVITAEQARQPLWQPDEWQPWGASKLAFNLRFIDHANPVVRPWAEIAPQITCPVLLLTGDPALGAIVSDGDAAALGKTLRQLRRAHILGAGHNLRRDQFAAYMAALRPQLAAWAAAE